MKNNHLLVGDDEYIQLDSDAMPDGIFKRRQGVFGNMLVAIVQPTVGEGLVGQPI
jgi:hypothetical protein